MSLLLLLLLRYDQRSIETPPAKEMRAKTEKGSLWLSKLPERESVRKESDEQGVEAT